MNINLLPRKGAREVLALRWFLRLKRGSVVVLGLYAAVLVVVFGVRLVMGRVKTNLDQQIEPAKAAVEAFASAESQHLLTKVKLQAASRILAEQKRWSELVAEVMEFIPQEAAITEVTLTPEGDFKISVETEQLQELAIMLNALFQIGLKQDFVQNVFLEKVEKTTLGTYGFTLVFET